MVKASITFPDGTLMEVDGSVDDIIAIKEKWNVSNAPQPQTPLSLPLHSSTSNLSGIQGRIDQLFREGFFASKKTISSIQSRLAEKGMIYGSGSLSPSLLRLVKKGILRRIKEEGQWRYVNP